MRMRPAFQYKSVLVLNLDFQGGSQQAVAADPELLLR